MKREDRHTAILERLYQKDRVDVDELTEIFRVSQETIRRDLTALAEEGLLRKIHGGAVRFQTAQENTFALRSQVNRAAKVAIAQYSQRFIDTGDSLFINAGTTTTIFAEQIIDHENLNVITNCATVANTIWTMHQKRHKVFLLGGEYNGTDTETYGALLINQLQHFQTDHAFITLGAINVQNGLMEYRVEAAEIVRVMIQQARKTTVLVDSHKLDKSALVKIADFDAVHRVVADILPSEQIQRALAEADVELHVTSLIQ